MYVCMQLSKRKFVNDISYCYIYMMINKFLSYLLLLTICIHIYISIFLCPCLFWYSLSQECIVSHVNDVLYVYIDDIQGYTGRREDYNTLTSIRVYNEG